MRGTRAPATPATREVLSDGRKTLTMVGARRSLPGEPRKGIVTLAGQMAVADATATKPPHPRPPPLYAQNDNSEPSARANQPTGTAAHTGGSRAIAAASDHDAARPGFQSASVLPNICLLKLTTQFRFPNADCPVLHFGDCLPCSRREPTDRFWSLWVELRVVFRPPGVRGHVRRVAWRCHVSRARHYVLKSASS